MQAEEYHEPGPLPPFEPGPLPPFCTSLGRARGQGVPAREGVPARDSLELWAVWPWEYHEPGPPNEPGPLAFPEGSSLCVCVFLLSPPPTPAIPLKTLTSLNKEVRPFLLSDIVNSIWSLHSVSSLSDYST